MKRSFVVPISLLFVAFFAWGCATHYQKTIRYQEEIYSGNFEKARDLLEKNRRDQTGKNKLLYLMNKGWVNWMLGQNEMSIQYLDEADRLIEDMVRQPGYEVAALFTNPGIRPYNPEDFEKVMVNYIKAMNFLQLGKNSEALVEVRRINLKINELNDKYKDRKNRYSADAFAHLIMGLIYDANREYNDAFIAYRNAFNAYESVYAENFGIKAPEQLRQDLLRTAYINGFHEELAYYEKKFESKYHHQPRKGGEVVFIWQNGFGPVKAEWGINFVKLDQGGGVAVFHNDELGLAFPFNTGNMSDAEKSAFAELSILRVAFPKYVERPTVFNTAEIAVGKQKYPLQKAQDINAIAFKTLQDRMLREMAGSLLRLATKKAMEMAVRQKNQDVGAAVGILAALAEKADTRNWQTLPHEIYYSRIPVESGKQTIEFKATGKGIKQSESFVFEVEAGKTYFHTFQSLESGLPHAGF